VARLRQGKRLLPARFFLRDTAETARELLGRRLVRTLPDGSSVAVIVVETEAYLGVGDRAAHTWNGRRTPRVLPMWGPGGHAYVYRIYGLHHCLNVVTKRAGEPEAVLVRAAVPEDEWLDRSAAGSLRFSGPGKLCAGLAITTALSGASLRGPELRLEAGPDRPFDVLVGPRVGVDYAGEAAAWPLRFGVAGCRAVTARKALSGSRPGS